MPGHQTSVQALWVFSSVSSEESNELETKNQAAVDSIGAVENRSLLARSYSGATKSEDCCSGP